MDSRPTGRNPIHPDIEADSPTPEDLFSILANKVRMDILRVLVEVDDPLSFVEIQELVGVRDSGQFNYHLNRMIGTFVDRNESDAYEYTTAGERVIAAILAGEFDPTFTFDPVRLPSPCPACKTDVMTTADNEFVTIECTTCEELLALFWIPNGAIRNRTPRELTHLFNWWLKHITEIKLNGICNNCARMSTPEIIDDAGGIPGEDPIAIEFRCSNCPVRATISISTFLYLNSDVRSEFDRAEIDITEIHAWNARKFLDLDIEIESTDPWEVFIGSGVKELSVEFVLTDDLSIERRGG